MAGGEGTRLRPLTCNTPKPMVPILNKPVMEHIILLLKNHNITDIAVTLAYLPSVITDYFGDGRDWGVNLHYFVEEVPLGTGGSVKNAQEFLDGTFLVISGDAFTDINLDMAFDYHNSKGSKVTIVSKKEAVPLEYGIIIRDNHGRILRFLEKPSWGEVFSDNINTGIYIIEPEVLNYYNVGDIFDFSKDLFPKLLLEDIPLYDFSTSDYWSDIGDLESYLKTTTDILNKKVKIHIPIKELKDGIWAEDGVFIEDSVSITPPVYIGRNSKISAGARLEPYTVIGNHCSIGKSSVIKRSVLWDNVDMGEYTHTSGGVICNGVKVKNGASIFQNSIVGSGTIIASNATINPEVKIWPGKYIEDTSTVKENLIWGTRSMKKLFGERDISGELNLDITPEFASSLGSAFVSTSDKITSIIVSCDGTIPAGIIKNSLITGIQSMGTRVINLKGLLLPQSRFAVKELNAQWGIHVRSNKTLKDRINIEIFDHKGATISKSTERKIENMFKRGDYNRVKGSLIPRVDDGIDIVPLYLSKGLTYLKNHRSIREKRPLVIAASKSERSLFMTETFLELAGCEVKSHFNIGKDITINELVKHISGEVKRKKGFIGIVTDEKGEVPIIIDDLGRPIFEDLFYLLTSFILLKYEQVNKLILPYKATTLIDTMAKTAKSQVIRTKSFTGDLLEKLLTEGSYYQYLLNFDGIVSPALILDYIIAESTKLSKVVDGLPPLNLKTREIICDWKDKGRILRELIDEYKDENLQLFEGVRIEDSKGWALILPDSERPIFNIYGHGNNEEFAQELTDFYSNKLQQLMNNKTEAGNIPTASK